jgi:hypothetical protein
LSFPFALREAARRDDDSTTPDFIVARSRLSLVRGDGDYPTRAAMAEIADWLGKVGLGQYAQAFAENDIDFSILAELTDQDLEKMGVASLGHRRQRPYPRLLLSCRRRSLPHRHRSPRRPKPRPSGGI